MSVCKLCSHCQRVRYAMPLGSAMGIGKRAHLPCIRSVTNAWPCTFSGGLCAIARWLKARRCTQAAATCRGCGAAQHNGSKTMHGTRQRCVNPRVDRLPASSGVSGRTCVCGGVSSDTGRECPLVLVPEEPLDKRRYTRLPPLVSPPTSIRTRFCFGPHPT